MSRPKITLHQHDHIPGRWYLRVTCDQHGFDWRLESPSADPGEWEWALTLAYGHACWAHKPLRPAFEVTVSDGRHRMSTIGIAQEDA